MKSRFPLRPPSNVADSFSSTPRSPAADVADPDLGVPFTSAPRARVLDQFARAQLGGDQLPFHLTSGLGATRLPLPRWKRVLDLAGCVFALPLLGFCTMAMIILNSVVAPGPVFFLQERVGYMGRRFKIYKFRTMRLGADCSIHQDHCRQLIRSNAPMVKLDSRGDTRLIPFGWLIRASGLDELPQLINVLRGEMSLVGPRPCLPSEFAEYVSWQRQRCDALPGLTGLWQVSGKNRTTFEQMIRLDIRYAREFSLGMDLNILIRTTPCLIRQMLETRRARRALPNGGRREANITDRPGTVTMKADSLASRALPLISPSSERGLIGWLHELRPSAIPVSPAPTQRLNGSAAAPDRPAGARR